MPCNWSSAAIILYSNPMKSMQYRKTAVPRQHPFGMPIWSLGVSVDTPQCMPLSALGAILYRWPETALQIARKDTPDALFVVLQEAFETRTKGALYFNSELLATVGLQEKVWTPFVLGENLTDYPAFEKTINALLTQIKNQKTEPNTAFVLKLLPETTAPGTSFHTITVTCAGLWDISKGFGFQETAYSKQDKGLPTRYIREFKDKGAFATALHDFITGQSLDYSVYRIQAHTVEMISQPTYTSLFRKLMRFCVRD